MEVKVVFEPSRDGSPMARIEGRVAFPDRKVWGNALPQIGEEWEVEVVGTSRSGNVYFLRGLRNLTQERRRQEEERRRQWAEEHRRMFLRLDAQEVVKQLQAGNAPRWETIENVDGWDGEDIAYAASVRLVVGQVSAEFPARLNSGGWNELMGNGCVKPSPRWAEVWPEFGEDIRVTNELPAEEGFALQEREFVGKTSRGRYATGLGKVVMTHWETNGGVPVQTDVEALEALKRQCREAEQAHRLSLEEKRLRELIKSLRNRVLLLLDGGTRCGVEYVRSTGVASDSRDYADGGEDGMKPPASGRQGLPHFVTCYDLRLDSRSIWDDPDGLLEAKERLERYLASLQEEFVQLVGGWPELPRTRHQVTVRRRGRYTLVIGRADAPNPISASFRDGIFLYRAERDGYSLSIWEEVSELEEAIEILKKEERNEAL